MKPPFNNIPGSYKFFQDGENKDEETKHNANTNFRVSWFEEQVDTFISRKIVSNYQVYNYGQGAPKEPPCRDSKQTSNSSTDESVQLEKKILTYPEKENEKDILSNFLEKLFSYNMDKLIAGTSSRNIDLRPCEVITGDNKKVTNQNIDECRERCSKSYYDAEESPEGSGDIVPFTALENFIKSAMDDSLAKFKEEINKAIDNKFESLRTIPLSATSLSAGDGEAKHFAGETSADSPRYTCLGNADLEDKFRDSLSADMAQIYESSKDRECEIFNLIQPEVRNIIFGHDSANFQSESINVIKKNISDTSVDKGHKNGLDEDSKISESEKLEAEHLSKVLNDTSLVQEKVKNTKDKEEEESATLIVGDYCKRVVPGCDDLSENCIAEAIKKSVNPKLMTDMTKFMYIIFESFRRLKEENLRRELGSCSESVNSSCESKAGDEPVVPKEEVKDDIDQTKEETESNIPVIPSSCKTVEPDMVPIIEPPTLITNQDPCQTICFPGNCSRDDRPIISLTSGVGASEDNSVPIIKDPNNLLDKSETGSLVDINESGYAVHKFKKKNIGYKPTTSSKVLENLKELYLQNLNNIEHKIVSSYGVGDKYNCQIKKKFSPGESRIGTRLDSKFYCNLRTKNTEKRNSSEISMRRINSRIRSKGSSNIVSVRHSLIKSRNRSTFKSLSKKREISLDSTVISLLDISLRNRSSWLKKLSSLSSDTPSEEEKVEEKANLLKRLCLITFTWGKKHKNMSQLMEQHLSNIYNAICLDFVTDDVYKSVLYVSDQLRSGSPKTKDEIMRRWVDICNKPLAKEKKSFNLESLHQIWVQFRTKIWHLARPPPIVPPNFFPALTYPSEENRLIKEQVIQKYARDILEYISDPKLYKQSVSLYSNDSIIL